MQFTELKDFHKNIKMILYLSCLSKLKDKMFNLNTKEAKNIEKENTSIKSFTHQWTRKAKSFHLKLMHKINFSFFFKSR